jgi:hypothetical protein
MGQIVFSIVPKTVVISKGLQYLLVILEHVQNLEFLKENHQPVRSSKDL